MRALVKQGPGRPLELREVPDPRPRQDEVLVRVRAVGVCGTDIHIADDVYAHADPLIPGHELAGDVVETGGGVQDWATGDRVVSELHVGACRTCERCRAGDPQICEHKRALGTWTDGAFAELVAIPAWLLHTAPEGLSYPDATLIEPAACALHGLLQRGQVTPGERVLVVGHGPIGLLAAQVARAAGAGQVIVSGTSRRGTARLDAARSLGFPVIDATTEDVHARVGELTGGHGADLAVETAGTEAALLTAIQAARRGGRVTVLGLCGRPAIAFPWDDVLLKDLDLVFSFSSNAPSWERVIDLTAAGEVGGDGIVSHVLPLERWADGFAAISSGAAVKVVLEP